MNESVLSADTRAAMRRNGRSEAEIRATEFACQRFLADVHNPVTSEAAHRGEMSAGTLSLAVSNGHSVAEVRRWFQTFASAPREALEAASN